MKRRTPRRAAVLVVQVDRMDDMDTVDPETRMGKTLKAQHILSIMTATLMRPL
ncbi:MAG: hypothetical protein R6V12_20435 [Candidatus Hydrogenedentota bacterium]